MELTHNFIVPADPETTWAMFMDLERVGGCFPGATVTEVTAAAFEGTVKVKLGPIALVYAGSGQFLSRDDAAYRAVIEAKGKDKRGNGTAGATVTIQLAPSGSGTRVDVATDLAITGKPAQFGRGVMQDVSDKLLQQFVTCIESQLATAPTVGGDPAGGDPAGGDPARGAPAEGDPAGGHLASDPGAGAGAGSAAAPWLGIKQSADRPPATAAYPARAKPPNQDAVDLGVTVLPVLARAYAPHLIAALIGVAVGWHLRGRRR